MDPLADAARRANEELGDPGSLGPDDATTEVAGGEIFVMFGDFCGNAPTCTTWVRAARAGASCPSSIAT